MRVPLKELMEKLGVDRVLSPYETQPWVHYDDEKALTCSAEVRMGPGASDVEAEIQFLKDNPDENDVSGGIEHIMFMRAEPAGNNEWAPRQLRVKGKDYVSTLSGWEKKGCEFFVACIQAISMGSVPDIDALIAQILDDDSLMGGGRGRIGRKSPKIEPAQLMGMKKM